MPQKRIEIEQSQLDYLEAEFGDDFKNDASKFRALIREHRKYARKLDLQESGDE